MRGTSLRGAVIHGRAMRGLDARGADLREADLSGCDLRDADFTGADLRHTVLNDTDLRGARFDDAQLEWVSAERADLRACDLGGLYLRGARFTGANLRGTRLDGAELGRAVFDDAALLRASLVDVRAEQTQFKRVRFDAANLTGARLGGADLSESVLEGADLRAARLRGANLSRVRAKGAQLANAELTDATLEDADLRDVEGAVFDANPARGARFGFRARDPWSQLRTAYTGPRLVFNVLLTVTALAPYAAQAAMWWVVNAMQTQANFVDATGRALCMSDACRDWYAFELVLGLHRGPSIAALTVALIAYSVLRAYLTHEVAPLREDEERSGILPAFSDYRRLHRLHQLVRVLFYIAVFSVAQHAVSWLGQRVVLPL